MSKSKTKQQISDQYSNLSYSELLEQLIIEIGDFIKLANKGKSIPYQARLARKKSVRITEIFLHFRKASIKNDQRNKNIMTEAKSIIKNLN